MKCVSWNVNGIRACINKGFFDVVKQMDADFFCVQETKMQEGQADINIEGYYHYLNSAEKRGYSGTLIYTKQKPISVFYGMNNEDFDQEGRLITLEYPNYYFITCYTPNSQNELKRLDYRMEWEEYFLKYLDSLDKPVILCGDLNVAHQEIDLKNPKTNRTNPGFTDQERSCISKLLNHGYIDTFRYLYPSVKEVYSWWSYRFQARKKNAGWRIDYFIVSQSLKDCIIDASIETEIMGSDHCPVTLTINL